MQNLSLKKLLFAGFGCVVAVIVAFGAFALSQMQDLASLTERLFRHPYTVSTNLRDINIAIVSMHRSMKDVALARNAAEIDAAVAAVDAWETRAFGHFDVVEDRFLGDPGRVATARLAFAEWRPIREDVVRLMRAGEREAAADITKGRGVAHLAEIEEAMDYLLDFANRKGDEFMARAIESRDQGVMMTIVALLAAMGLAMSVAWLVSSSLRRPLGGLEGAMRRLAADERDVDVPYLSHGAEIGAMARAVQVFKENAERVRELMASMEGKDAQEARMRDMARLQDVVAAAIARVSEGDLTARIDDRFDDPEMQALTRRFNDLIATLEDSLAGPRDVLGAISRNDLSRRVDARLDGAFGELQRAVNETADKLTEMMRRVERSSTQVRESSEEIASQAGAVSNGATQNAAALEETLAALNELAASVDQNALGASEAVQMAQRAESAASEGGEVIATATDAMRRIQEGSARISDIVTMIDGIAFQTNLLALNASVEAARAGDAGKGFAVVASEVRELAQRSADASRDIKALIEESGAHVEAGVDLVNRTNASLERIGGAIDELRGQIDNIATACGDQSQGLREIKRAAEDMDASTQANAGAAERTSAALRDVIDLVDALSSEVSQYELGRAARAA